MAGRTYPYEAWTLTAGFNPKKVTLEKVSFYGDHDVSDTGKIYNMRELHETRGAAIRAGFALCDKQQADIRKRQERLDKRVASLEKANDTPESE